MPIRIGVDNGVGRRFGNGGFDILQLVEGRVHLRGKAGRRRADEALVAAAAGKLQDNLIFRFCFHYVNLLY